MTSEINIWVYLYRIFCSLTFSSLAIWLRWSGTLYWGLWRAENVERCFNELCSLFCFIGKRVKKKTSKSIWPHFHHFCLTTVCLNFPNENRTDGSPHLHWVCAAVFFCRTACMHSLFPGTASLCQTPWWTSLWSRSSQTSGYPAVRQEERPWETAKESHHNMSSRVIFLEDSSGFLNNE